MVWLNTSANLQKELEDSIVIGTSNEYTGLFVGKGGIKAKNLRKIIVQAGLNNINESMSSQSAIVSLTSASRVIHEYQDKLYRILRIQDTGDHLTIHIKKRVYK